MKSEQQGQSRNIQRVRLGKFIKCSTSNNHNLIYGSDLIQGVTNEGKFSRPRGSLLDIDLKPYKIVENGAFVYNPSRLDLGSIAYRTEGLCIVSHLYIVFYLNEEGKKQIDPEYLFMYFRRDEFYREVTFRNFGSQRPEFNFYDMSDIIMPLPDISVQRKYVNIYKSMVANQQSYQRGLEDLKLTCDGYIEELRHKMPCKSISRYIHEENMRNNDLAVTDVQGVTSAGVFDETKANTAGIDFSNYKVVHKNQFAYNPSRINLGSLALREDSTDCIVSPMYCVFSITDEKKLLPRYLRLWLSRAEFLRSTLFYATGSVRDTFDFNLMQEVKIPIPDDVKIQESIVELYSAYIVRREINERLKNQIKDICPILIKGSLEEQPLRPLSWAPPLSGEAFLGSPERGAGSAEPEGFS